MAQKVSIELVSDLSGKAADETVTFGLDGTSFELDLESKEADKFRGLFQDYIAVARKVSGGRGKKASSPKSANNETKAIKEWADAQGIDYPKRGRLPQSLLDQYHGTKS